MYTNPWLLLLSMYLFSVCSSHIDNKTNDKQKKEAIQRENENRAKRGRAFSFSSAFIVTHSGLTNSWENRLASIHWWIRLSSTIDHRSDRVSSWFSRHVSRENFHLCDSLHRVNHRWPRMKDSDACSSKIHTYSHNLFHFFGIYFTIFVDI